MNLRFDPMHRRHHQAHAHLRIKALPLTADVTFLIKSFVVVI
jgi:hypothetical protein